MNQLLPMSVAQIPPPPVLCPVHAARGAGPQLLEAGTSETVTSLPSGRRLEGAVAEAPSHPGLAVFVGVLLPRASAPAPLVDLLPTGTLHPPPTASLAF